jgi:hypothetical protein
MICEPRYCLLFGILVVLFSHLFLDDMWPSILFLLYGCPFREWRNNKILSLME